MRWSLTALLTAAALFLASPLLAQDPGGDTVVVEDTAPAADPRLTELGRPDYDVWTDVSARAGNVLESERADLSVFEALRAELVGWRAIFSEAQAINGSRRESLQAQIDALGPPPAEGEPAEPEETATLRADLTAQLAEARAPSIRASAAMEEAESLISQIDQTIAARQTDALLRSGASPLNPAYWPTAAADVARYAQEISTELGRRIASPDAGQTLRENFLPVALLLIGGLLLTFRSYRWVGNVMSHYTEREATSPVARLILFGLTLAQAILPTIGFAAMIEALQRSGYTGLRGEVAISALPYVAIGTMLGFWIGRQVFPISDHSQRPLDLMSERRRKGRRAAIFLGLFIGLEALVATIAMAEAWDEATLAVVLFPFIVVASFFLGRLGRLILTHARNVREAAGADGPGRAIPIYTLLGRAVMLIAILAALLGAAGFLTAAEYFLFPSIISLGLIGTIGILQRLVTDSYGALTGRREGLEEALTPTLIGFILILLSLPLFALIWGVRPAQLLDLWSQFLNGFDLGGVTVSPANFLTFAVVFAALYTAVRLLQSALKNSILPKTKMDSGAQMALTAGTGYLGIFLAGLISITAAGIDLSNIALVAGALSLGIGFGLQTIVSNFVSGIILLIERPIKEGDWIQVGGTMGYVRRISVRSTRIETFDRTDVIVPNQDLIAGSVINYTHHNNVGRLILPVGVAYGTDTRRVDAILSEVAESHPMVILDPPPSITFAGFGADSLDFEIRAILRDVNFTLAVRSELNHLIAERFTAEGIEIPFAQRDVWLRNPEVLRAAPPAPDDTP